MFSGGLQLREGLTLTLCLQWSINDVRDDLTGKEGFSEELTIPMHNLTLEIANLFPNAVHVHHQIKHNFHLFSFYFTITRSPEGLVSVVTDRKSFAKHEYFDSQFW